jgi:hypothetical protein
MSPRDLDKNPYVASDIKQTSAIPGRGDVFQGAQMPFKSQYAPISLFDVQGILDCLIPGQHLTAIITWVGIDQAAVQALDDSVMLAIAIAGASQSTQISLFSIP